MMSSMLRTGSLQYSSRKYLIPLTMLIQVYLAATQPYTSDTDSEDDAEEKLRELALKMPKVGFL